MGNEAEAREHLSSNTPRAAPPARVTPKPTVRALNHSDSLEPELLTRLLHQFLCSSLETWVQQPPRCHPAFHCRWWSGDRGAAAAHMETLWFAGRRQDLRKQPQEHLTWKRICRTPCTMHILRPMKMKKGTTSSMKWLKRVSN